MKVISVKQPYAGLIMAGIKKVETRSFNTTYRGPLAIHASLAWAKTDEGLEDWLDDNAAAIAFPGRLKRYLYDKDLLIAGHILGFVQVTGCMPAGDWIEKNHKSLATYPNYTREWALGDLSSNRFAWILSDPRPITPIIAKGRLGFWEHSALDQLV